ncbi:MAG: hypothetical protein ACFFDI_25500 [Promethearchaeota archaeon]
MRFNPFYSFIRTFWYIASRRVHFPLNRIGEELEVKDERFVIFRQVIIDPHPNQQEKPGAIFRVRFRLANMSLKQNIRFSRLPIPFFIGLPGFRSKIWMHNESTGWCFGIYEWDSVQAAEKYVQSFAVRFMTRRSVPGSISHGIIPK